MSREERRQYQRMTKGIDRTASLPPAARARAERIRARREARASDRAYGFGPRFWLTAIAIAIVVGLVGFSLQWPNMPFALYVGIAVGTAAVLAQAGIRLLQRRAASR